MLVREGNAFYEIDEACAAKKKLQEDEQQQKAEEKEKDVIRRQRQMCIRDRPNDAAASASISSFHSTSAVGSCYITHIRFLQILITLYTM